MAAKEQWNIFFGFLCCIDKAPFCYYRTVHCNSNATGANLPISALVTVKNYDCTNFSGDVDWKNCKIPKLWSSSPIVLIISRKNSPVGRQPGNFFGGTVTANWGKYKTTPPGWRLDKSMDFRVLIILN
jgi:hypothetical protein